MSRLQSVRKDRPASEEDSCQFALDKWAQIEAARASGFTIIPTQLVETEADIKQFPMRPAILKPRAVLNVHGNGAKKGRAFFIADQNAIPPDARLALSREKYLIQEYKAGVGEGVFGIAHDGRIYGAFGHRRLRMMNPAGSGSSACVSRTPGRQEVIAADALIRLVAWRGPFMIELLRDHEGKTWFMEFNGRFWGSLALARRCGFDMPRIACALVSGQEPDIPLEVTPRFARHLGRDLVHLLFVFVRDPNDDIHVVTMGASDFHGARRDLVETLSVVRNHGGAAVLAHPRRRDALRGVTTELLDMLDGIEIWNRKLDGLMPVAAYIEFARNNGLSPVVAMDLHTWRQVFPMWNEIQAGDKQIDGDVVAQALRERQIAPGCIAGKLQTSFNGGFSLGLIFLAVAEHVRRHLRDVRDSIRSRLR